MPTPPRAHKTITVLAILATTAVAWPATPAHADPTVDELEAQVEQASTKLETLVEDHNRVSAELDRAQRYTDQLGTDLADTRAELDDTDTTLADLATVMYAEGRWHTLSSVLGGSPSELADKLTILDYVGQRRAEQFDRLTDEEAMLAAEQSRVDQLEGDVLALSTELDDQRAEVTEAESELARLRGMLVGHDEYRPDESSYDLSGPPAGSGAGAAAVQYAYQQIGAPYVWGAAGPDGYDCSGLTSAAWRSAGVDLPHSSQMQYNVVPHIGAEQLQPGDLVFYYDDLHHVAIYAGEGKIVHATSEGNPVRVAPIDSMPVAGYGRPA